MECPHKPQKINLCVCVCASLSGVQQKAAECVVVVLIITEPASGLQTDGNAVSYTELCE